MVRVNGDFSNRVVLHAAGLPWVPSPMAGVERRGEIVKASASGYIKMGTGDKDADVDSVKKMVEGKMLEGEKAAQKELQRRVSPLAIL